MSGPEFGITLLMYILTIQRDNSMLRDLAQLAPAPSTGSCQVGKHIWVWLAFLARHFFLTLRTVARPVAFVALEPWCLVLSMLQTGMAHFTPCVFIAGSLNRHFISAPWATCRVYSWCWRLSTSFRVHPPLISNIVQHILVFLFHGLFGSCSPSASDQSRFNLLAQLHFFWFSLVLAHLFLYYPKCSSSSFVWHLLLLLSLLIPGTVFAPCIRASVSACLRFLTCSHMPYIIQIPEVRKTRCFGQFWHPSSLVSSVGSDIPFNSISVLGHFPCHKKNQGLAALLCGKKLGASVSMLRLGTALGEKKIALRLSKSKQNALLFNRPAK